MRGIIAALGLLIILSAQATVERYQFSSDEQAQQFYTLTEQLRCPKCQNNNIAESNSEIATDMRNKVYQLLQQGYNKQQVVEYMVDRYGYFVTYDPPLTPLVILLWISPLLFITIALLFLIRHIRQRGSPLSPLSSSEQQELEKLLHDKKQERL